MKYKKATVGLRIQKERGKKFQVTPEKNKPKIATNPFPTETNAQNYIFCILPCSGGQRDSCHWGHGILHLRSVDPCQDLEKNVAAETSRMHPVSTLESVMDSPW